MPARFPMIPVRHPQQEYICNDDDLGCLYDYMMAAMAGNDISELPRLWNQEIGVIKSLPHTSATAPALESVPEVSTCNHSACRVYGPCIDAYEDYEAPPCAKYQTKEHNTAIRAEAAKAAREQAQQSIDAAIEQLSDINKYAREEYEEANLSDNEREMRIHLEYGNRVWGVVRFLRSQQEGRR